MKGAAPNPERSMPDVTEQVAHLEGKPGNFGTDEVQKIAPSDQG